MRRRDIFCHYLRMTFVMGSEHSRPVTSTELGEVAGRACLVLGDVICGRFSDCYLRACLSVELNVLRVWSSGLRLKCR